MDSSLRWNDDGETEISRRRFAMSGGWVKIIQNGMESVYLIEAEYKGGYRLFLRFNTGEAGEVDLNEVVHQYQAAEPIRDKGRFAAFYLDSWPTLAWACGFDMAPEALYFMATGKSLFELEPA